VCLPLAVRHRPAIHIHRRLDARVAHQLPLDSNRCVGLVQR
jgi:hypothetical protein